MRRRDFIRGLMALGVTAAVADQLAFVQGLGRVFPVGEAKPDHLTASEIRVMIEEAADRYEADMRGVMLEWQRDSFARLRVPAPLLPPQRKWFTLYEVPGTPVAVKRKGL